MRTPTIEVTRTYDPNIEAQLTALEILLRAPPRDGNGDRHEATLDEHLKADIQGQKGDEHDTRSAA